MLTKGKTNVLKRQLIISCLSSYFTFFSHLNQSLTYAAILTQLWFPELTSMLKLFKHPIPSLPFSNSGVLIRVVFSWTNVLPMFSDVWSLDGGLLWLVIFSLDDIEGKVHRKCLMSSVDYCQLFNLQLCCVWLLDVFFCIILHGQHLFTHVLCPHACVHRHRIQFNVQVGNSVLWH